MNMATATERPYRFRGSYATGMEDWTKIGNLHDRYRHYIDNLLGRPNVTLVRYEDYDLQSCSVAAAGSHCLRCARIYESGKP